MNFTTDHIFDDTRQETLTTSNLPFLENYYYTFTERTLLFDGVLNESAERANCSLLSMHPILELNQQNNMDLHKNSFRVVGGMIMTCSHSALLYCLGFTLACIALDDTNHIAVNKSAVFHPSIFTALSSAGLCGQQSKQRGPDFPLPGYLLQLF